jgi:two-component system sensor histidine kinase AgrC
MMLRLALVLEIMAVLVCIHRLYGRKVKLDIWTAALYLACLLIFDVINMYGFTDLLAVGAYVLVGVYCVRQQKDSFVGAVVSIALMQITIAVLQFAFAFPLNIFWAVDESVRIVVVNMLVLGCCIWGIPKGKLAVLRMAVKRYERYAFLLVGFAVCVIMLMRFQEKVYKELRLEMFIFAVPALVIFFRLAEMWDTAQCEKQEAEKELQVTASMQEKYDELLKSVRLHQHEFKNHLAAILSAQYTYNSYEKLVKAQNEYSNKILQENRYHILLALGDKVLAGFLYGKFQELEAEGIKVVCQIKGAYYYSRVPVHHMVEMLGILLDNASQALHDADEAGKEVSFCLLESERNYQFIVCNKFPYVAYSEMEKWFQMGSSTKGEGRGIGLFHVKKLCEELGCEICCKNVEIEGENWIEFALKTGKADG